MESENKQSGAAQSSGNHEPQFANLSVDALGNTGNTIAVILRLAVYHVTEPNRTRPTFFNLLRIAFPVGAVTSIGHRISGVVLVFCAPVLIYLLDVSLRSAGDYERVRVVLDTVSARGVVAVIVWAFAHHFFAGIRHLLMDIDVGSSLAVARRSAWLVNVAGAGVALIGVGMLL